MRTNIKKELDTLGVSDIYSLMLFILYKTKDIPEYAVLSEICYLLDSRSLIRLFNYFGGRTITIPTAQEFKILTSALLLYQKVNLEHESYVDAIGELPGLTKQDKSAVTDLYLKIIPIINNYNINRGKPE